MFKHYNFPIKSWIRVAKGMIIYVREQDIVSFSYQVDKDYTFEFGLLSEVGEKWKCIFEGFLHDHPKYKLEMVDTQLMVGDRIDYYYGMKLNVPTFEFEEEKKKKK